jgi:hypothetical protein
MPSLQEIVAQARAAAHAAAQLVPQQTEPSAFAGSNPQASTLAGAPANAGGLPFVASAPEGTPLAVELITTRELAELASKLSHAKNENKQTIGRALMRAISGQLWAPDGHRNTTAYQIAAECVEAFPNLDPSSTVRCFSAAISNAQAQGSKMSAEKWQGMIERVQADRQIRLNMVGQFAARQSAMGEALEQQAKRTWPSDMPVSQEPNPLPMPVRTELALPSGAPSHPTDSLASVVHSLVILADGTYYLRRPGETHYAWRLKNLTALRIEMARQFGVHNQTIVTHDSKGNALPETQFLEVYCSNAHRIVYDYKSEATTWEAETATLKIGFAHDVEPPRADMQVHNWLCELVGGAGDDDARIEGLYDWLASCTRAHIDSPAAALVLVGPSNAGKGMIARALAATWGVLPVPLENAVARFNGALTESPIWWADERTPEDLTDDKFRTIVQERERLVEHKGKEKVLLMGCARLVFTLNEPDDFRIGGIEGPDAVRAVADRIRYFDCRGNRERIERAMDPLMLLPGRMDLPRIVSHLRWVQTAWAASEGAPRPQRFLGAQTDREAAERFVIRQMGRNYADVYETILEYLTQPGTWEAGYHAERRQFEDGLRLPLVTQHGCLWIWQTEFSKRLASKDPRALRNALKAIRTGNHAEISFGARRLRADYQEIDLDKLAIAANIQPDSESWQAIVKTVSQDTRHRRPDLT